MSSFKAIAYQILKEAKKPMHSREITEIALKKRLIKTSGKTPEATMNAQLITDINSKKGNSLFEKAGPSIFALNKKVKPVEKEAGKTTKKAPLGEEFVKHSIIKWLSATGWGHFKYGQLHEKGADIIARHTRYARYFVIETKGQSTIRQGDEVAFIYSLGQIITRMNTRAQYYYGIGLPETAARIARRRIPWQVAQKLKLHVLAVDHEGKVTDATWKDLKNVKESK